MSYEFLDGFETGDFSLWTMDPAGWGFDIITSPVHAGGFAARSQAAGAGGLWHTLNCTPKHNYTVAFWLCLQGDSAPVGVSGDVLVRVMNVAGTLDILVYVVSGQVANEYSLRLVDNVAGANTYGIYPLHVNRWYNIKLEVQVLQGSARHSLFINNHRDAYIDDDTTGLNADYLSMDPVGWGAPYNTLGIIDGVIAWCDSCPAGAEYPAMKITINGEEVQEDILSADVTLRENAIADCLLIANDYEGEVFLNKANLNDEVCVWHDVGDGAGWVLVFSGWVKELNPEISMGGETVGIQAYGKGIMFKWMRVRDEFGIESSVNADGIDTDLAVNNWVNVNNDFTHFGAADWIDSDDADTSYIENPADNLNAGDNDEYYGFPDLNDLLACYDYFEADKVEVTLKAKLVAGGGGAATSQKIAVYLWDCDLEIWSLGGQITIVNTAPYVDYTLDITSLFSNWDLAKVNALRLKLVQGATVGGGATKGTWRITYVTLDLEGVAACYTTLCSIIRDTVIPDYVEDILNTGVASGWNINDNYIAQPMMILSNCSIAEDGCGNPEPYHFRYLSSPYEPTTALIRDMFDVITASRAIDGCTREAGFHWWVKPVCGEEPSLLMMAPIGNHFLDSCAGFYIENEWQTNYGGGANPEVIEVKKDMLMKRFSQREVLANYIVNFGKYEIPGSEDSWTEDCIDEWFFLDGTYVRGGINFASPVTAENDTTNYIIGSASLHMDLGAAGASYAGMVYPNPATYPYHLNLDVNRIGTRRSFPKIGLYIMKKNLSSVQIWIGTGDIRTDDNLFKKDVSALIPNDDEWTWVTVPIGPYYPMKEVNMTPWTSHNNPNWNQIDWIMIVAQRPGTGQSDIRVDGLRITGIITRGAYHSGSITANGCRIGLITDNLAKSSILDADDDSGMVAQFAKAELFRSMTQPISGTFMIPLQPNVQPGQIVHIHASKQGDETFNIDIDMRILKIHHHYGMDGAKTNLEVIDDVLNSYVRKPADAYNTVLKATNPDYQNRDLGNLKGRDIDILQDILAKDYA